LITNKTTFFVAGVFALLFSCATFKSGDQNQEQKAASILSTQKALIYNYLNNAETQRAFQEIISLRRQHPKDPELLNFYGLALLARKEPLDAVKAFQESYSLKPNIGVALNLSSAYMEVGKTNAAKKILFGITKNRAEFDLYAFPERVYHNLALCYSREKKSKLAEKNYKKALDLNPGSYMSLMGLGDHYARQGRQRDALSQYQKAKLACQNCFEATQLLSQTYLNLGSKNLAARAIEEFLQRNDTTDMDRKRAIKLQRSLQPRRN
jgi:tetratricopeptide (TPR) repeat protein